MHDTKKFAVIVAGGKGLRMGNAVPKQFLPLKGKPILTHTILAFLGAYPDVEIILVLPADQLSYAQIMLQSLPHPIDVTIVAGGATRFHSVQNGLDAITENGIVFIHDGVRPLVSVDLIRRCYTQALVKGSAIPAIPAIESMRIIDGDDSQPIDRDFLRVIQTPQTFKTEIIIPAFKQEYSALFTDEATVAEANGEKIFLIDGEKRNIKVTTPEDMVMAEAFLRNEE